MGDQKVMGFYSFIVVSQGEVAIPEHLIYLDGGRNVFNVMLDDLDTFKTRLTNEGVEIVQCNRLDEFEQLDEPLDIELEQDPFDDDPPLPGTR